MSQPIGDEKSGGNSPQMRTIALVAVGSNLPNNESDVKETVEKAVALIAREIGLIRGVSRFFRTPAFPPGSGPDFINAALAVDTTLEPAEMLRSLHAIEKRFGRVRRERWAARTLDLDLIAFGDLILPDSKTHQNWAELPLDQQMQHTPEQLILPHPRLTERAFVLVPLKDVAAEWRHPVTGLSVSEMLAALSAESVSEVVAL